VPASITVDIANIPSIAPAHDYDPEIGVPRVQLESELMIPSWLINGPFIASGKNPLQDTGGFSQFPEPGASVLSQGLPVEWRAYRPSGDAFKTRRGPVFYPRNCMKFVTKSTGMGYPPGIQVHKKLSEGTDAKPKLAVALFTVWENDRERYVMAAPNWHWASRGIRMWINGTAVNDGDIVRVTPGRYPVMVHMPILGGYQVQAPHLIEMLPSDLAIH
jgi:hypothetical protein